MTIRNGANAIELIVLERIPDDLPTPGDVRLRVRVEVEGFAGFSDRAWIEKAVLHRFVEGVQELERTRKGEATLESMSPGEFALQLRSVDRAGHLAATGQLKRVTYGAEVHEQRLHFGFDLDSGTVSAFVQALRSEMLGPQQSPR